MAPEPLHLVGIVKTCPRCGSQDVKYAYNNNKKPTQPRYKCNGPGCGGRFFTYGGTCRAVPVNPPRSSIGVAGGRHTRMAKPKPVELPVGAVPIRQSARIPANSEPFELLESPAESAGRSSGSPVGAVGRPTLGTVGVRCIPAKSESVHELPETTTGSGGSPAAGSTVGAVAVDQRPAAIPQGGEARDNWAKAVLGIPPTILFLPASNLSS